MSNQSDFVVAGGETASSPIASSTISPGRHGAIGAQHDSLAEQPERLKVCLVSIRSHGENIRTFRLAALKGCRLPMFTAGSHIDVHIRDGLTRQYSISSDPADPSFYEITVQREPLGRGGSVEVFETFHLDKKITISPPRNNFPLREDAKHHLFLAGGIGITPFMSMLQRAEAVGQPYHLHCCSRAPERTAFLSELQALSGLGKASLHHDGGDPLKGLDIRGLLQTYHPGTHLYYCGPEPFMRAVAEASRHWPSGTVHFEYFAPVARPKETPHTGRVGSEAGVDFRIRLARRGTVLDVPHDVSIVEVLRQNGIEIVTSCEAGVCGTCRVRYMAGCPDHRDFVLEEEERRQVLLACCARSLGPEIELDL